MDIETRELLSAARRLVLRKIELDPKEREVIKLLGDALDWTAGQPDKMKWHTVVIIAPEGFEFGVLSDSLGVLQLAVRAPDGEWVEEPTSGCNKIAPGHKAYIVINDDDTAESEGRREHDD